MIIKNTAVLVGRPNNIKLYVRMLENLAVIESGEPMHKDTLHPMFIHDLDLLGVSVEDALTDYAVVAKEVWDTLNSLSKEYAR